MEILGRQHEAMKIINFNFALLLLILAHTLVSCEKNNPNTSWINETHIYGQLTYVANPFSREKDSVLCLRNVRDLVCVAKTDDFYSYIKNLLSHYDGKFGQAENNAPQTNHITFYPTEEMCFFPTRNGVFLSVIDSTSGCKMQSIPLSVSIETGNRIDKSTAVIRLETRQTIDENSQSFYIGDYVVFQGNDNMQPKFLHDTITFDNELIICFDGVHGPCAASSPDN